MAVATVTLASNAHTPSPRRAAAAPDVRVPPRVYSPFPHRRLARPMAVRADAETTRVVPGRPRWFVFRARRDTTPSA